MFFILSNSFGQINLTNGLVGYFPLNNSTVDLSQLHQNGIGFFIQPTNGVLGHPNNAYFFNGNNSHIDYGTSNRGVNYIVTISAWFKTTSHNYEWIVGQYDWQQDSGYHVAVQNDRLFLAGRNGTGNYIRVDSNVNVVDGKWHHVLAEINNNTWSIWVDCQFYNTVSSVYNPDITPNNIDLSVGYYPVGDNGYHCYFNGSIDEVRIYNRVLTTDEKDFLCQIETANLNEIAGKEYLKIYPNPVNQTLHIELKTNKITSLKVFDITGKLVLKSGFSGSKKELNVQTLKKGTYLLQLSNENEVYNHLFIKE